MALRQSLLKQDASMVIGFFTEQQNLIGVLDMVRDYPVQGDWWIGLLLLDPKYRCQSIGQQIYSALEGWVSQHGARRVCLGVVDQNQGAFRFWRKIGLEQFEIQPARYFGNAVHAVIIMRRTIMTR
jgi:ribosomal protein S18 acetylase RimI-like enzyme